jgi:hypothetical protein
MENKQTSTEWLESEFIKLEQTIGVHGIMYELIEQAKAMENKTDIQELINRNYAAQIKRGQINNESTFWNFSDKIQDELNEFDESYIETNKDFDSKELIDIMLVCFSMAKHFGIDWQKVMTEKVEYNETRLD